MTFSRLVNSSNRYHSYKYEASRSEDYACAEARLHKIMKFSIFFGAIGVFGLASIVFGIVMAFHDHLRLWGHTITEIALGLILAMLSLLNIRYGLQAHSDENYR